MKLDTIFNKDADTLLKNNEKEQQMLIILQYQPKMGSTYSFRLGHIRPSGQSWN